MAGFVIAGQESKPVLIRAVGPTLGQAPFNLPGTLADPRLDLYRGSTAITSNTGIAAGGNSAAVAVASLQIGAFALRSYEDNAARAE